MTPDEHRSRWSDERIDDLADKLRAIAPVVQSSAVQGTQIDDLARNFDKLERSVERLMERLDSVGEAISADQQARRSSRTQVLVAVITGSLAIIGTVVAAILASGGPG